MSNNKIDKRDNVEVVGRGELSASAHRELSPEMLRKRINMIQKLIAEVLIPDVHYYTVPGSSKPALGKPGAEYVLLMFGLHLTDAEVEDLSTDREIRYRVTARIRDGAGYIMGVGLGECSTAESKYAWRRAVCEEEWDDTPDNKRRKKWLDDGGHVLQVRTEPADNGNTVLKMAKKRAMVDATLTSTAASDAFEQDLDESGYQTGDSRKTGKRTRKAAGKAKGKAVHVDAIKAVKIKKEGQSGSGKAWTIWEVVAEDGTAFQTFSDDLSGIASELAGQGIVVSIQWEKDKYGKKLLGIEDGPQTPEEPPPPSDDDSPPSTDDVPAEADRDALMAELKAAKKTGGLTWDDVAEFAKQAGVKSMQSKNWSAADVGSILDKMP